MAEWEGFSDAARAMIPDDLADVGGKGMVAIDDELIGQCADATEYLDAVLDKLIALADNIKLNNPEHGEATAMVTLLKLTEKMTMTTVGAQVMLARLITKIVWKEDE